MQFPVNPIDYHQVSFQKELLPEVVKRKIAVLAMKTAAGGSLVKEKICTMDECLRYVLTLPTSVVISGMDSVARVRGNAARVRGFRPYSAAETDALLTRIERRAQLGLEWYKRDRA